MNHDVFISYSSKQKSIADGVCHYLEENGFKCWMAPRDIPIGSEYGDLIEKAIKACKAVVLVFSEAASISKWVKGEINVAFSEDKPILPFRVDETEIKGGFRVMLNQMHWIDAYPHYADRLPDLLDSISGLLGRSARKVIVQDDTTRRNETIGEKPSRSEKTKGSINGHEYVDLGLPSGTLWATCNVDADKIENYGGYYAWGETQTKTAYDWDTYKYANDNRNKLTKYCDKPSYGDKFYKDHQTELQSSDDPATVNWGSGWKTPSEKQWRELLSHTTNQWITKNGVKGRLFTAKNGQMLFLPAAGNRWGDVLHYDGSVGNYWSKSLYKDDPNNAWSLYFGSYDCDLGDYGRSNGFSVRPVRED